MRIIPVLVALAACQLDPATDTDDPEVSVPAYDGYIPLEPTDQLIRASMALRGMRPSIAELETIAADPSQLPALVADYAEDPAFAATVKDMWAEILLMRSTELRLPALGALAGDSLQAVQAALAEEPLRLIAHIVTEDLPFTDIVTADFTILDGVGARMWDGHDHQGSAAPAVTRFSDGRPPAGILASNGLWIRHASSGSNANRARANLISDTMLCTDFLDLDVPITGNIDLSDEAAVADAVMTQPECVSCHQNLDPLASHLWGFVPQGNAGIILRAFDEGCVDPGVCYPTTLYRPEYERRWARLGLREPGYFGLASSDLADLGQHIADDPRFASCMATRFYSYLTQTDLDEVPADIVTELEGRLIASGFDAKALAVDIALHPAFQAVDAEDLHVADTLPGLQLLRPEQGGRMVEALTGFRFWYDADFGGCNYGDGATCYGPLSLTDDDVFGIRSMAGGIDGARVTRPTHTPTPTRLLWAASFAAEAAGWVVPRDLGSPTTARLLTSVTATTSDEPKVRVQLADLHARILGELVATHSPEVDDSYALFEAGLESHGSPEGAWKVVLTAMFQSPRVLFY